MSLRSVLPLFLALTLSVGCRRLVAARDKESASDARAPGPRFVSSCASGERSCGLLEEHSLACWGLNELNELSDDDVAQLHAPLRVAGVVDGRELHCNNGQACVLTGDGRVVCKGFFASGPVQIPFPGPVRELILHADGACALLTDERLVCTNAYLNAIRGDAVDGKNWFVELPGRHASRHLAQSSLSVHWACIYGGNEPPFCFDAQRMRPRCSLTKGSSRGPDCDRPNVPDVVAFPSLREAPELAVWSGSVCGRFADLHIACEKLGDAHPRDQGTLGINWSEVRASAFMASNLDIACVRTIQGAVRCGTLPYGDAGHRRELEPQSVERALANQSVEHLSLSQSHGCALSAGRLSCFGAASDGQLGDGTSYIHDRPVRIELAGKATALAAFGTTVCALAEDGRLSCWGQASSRFSLPPPTLDEPATALSVGEDTVCRQVAAGWQCWIHDRWIRVPGRGSSPAWVSNGAVLMTDQRTWRWSPLQDGVDERLWPYDLDQAGFRLRKLSPDGLCGVDSKGRGVCQKCEQCTTPFRVFDDVAEISSPFGAFVCAVGSDGGLRCKEIGGDYRPFEVENLVASAPKRVLHVRAPARYRYDKVVVCAVDDAGAVYCAADKFGAMLGAVGPASRHLGDGRFRRIVSLPKASDVAVGHGFVCALVEEGDVYCWGSNREGAIRRGPPAFPQHAVEVRPPR